ncbi:hypothetical protein BD626DRAFT_506124 [Schizophyllum amplum]|uniref:F-box domain-containing protein n=1 Tax=Schizophyllum amplum TaxID=97359 RepID=A0A550C5B0_9AGAR|nr:hypothetical protein BD626DRAFT_506124 [Auriculariopsis ampla]
MASSRRSKFLATELVKGAQTAWLNLWSANRPPVLTELPLDMIYEISTHLHPADLLGVSRLNKTLRQMLLQKSSRWLWRASFERYSETALGRSGYMLAGPWHGGPGIAYGGGPANAYGGPGTASGCPKTPDDLSEPEYARFLFDDLCMNCSAPGGIYIAWKACMRYCEKCVSILHIFSTLEEAIPQDADLGRTFTANFVLAVHCEGNDIDLYVRSEVEAFVTELGRLQDRDAGTDTDTDTDTAMVIHAWLEEQRAYCQKAYGHMIWLDEWKRERERIRIEAKTREKRRNWGRRSWSFWRG